MINPQFNTFLPEINKIFAAYPVKNAYLFGSVLTDRFNEHSDVDFIVNFKDNLDPIEKGEAWWNLHDNLCDLFHRDVDIVSESSLKNPYFIEELNETKYKIYG